MYSRYTSLYRERERSMGRFQLVMPDDDHARFANQASREGMSLSAWLRAAARERLERQSSPERFGSLADVDAFFAQCDALAGPEVEPDWKQHRALIAESRRRGASET